MHFNPKAFAVYCQGSTTFQGERNLKVSAGVRQETEGKTSF